VTGALDAWRWRVPLEAVAQPGSGPLQAERIGALLGPAPDAATEPALALRSAEPPPPRVEEPPPEPAPRSVPQPVHESAAADAGTRRLSIGDLAPSEIEPPLSSRPDGTGIGIGPLREEHPLPEPEDRPVLPAKPVRPLRPRKPAEPKIFISPRAPDDPGPEAADSEGLGSAPYRPTGAKA
jgi:HemY protein